MDCKLNRYGICGGKDCPASCPHLAVVQRLQFLTNGNVVVLFSPDSQFEGDEASMGHLYTLWLRAANDYDDGGVIDDRGPDSLEQQLLRELHRLTEFPIRVLEETSQRIAKKPRSRKSRKKAVAAA